MDATGKTKSFWWEIIEQVKQVTNSLPNYQSSVMIVGPGWRVVQLDCQNHKRMRMGSKERLKGSVQKNYGDSNCPRSLKRI